MGVGITISDRGKRSRPVTYAITGFGSATMKTNTQIEIPAVILAGGLGRRLRPLTEECPKVMVGIEGRPFIHHLLMLLHRKGFCQVILCVGYLGEQVENYLGDGDWLGLQIEHSYDDQNSVGTASAIRKVLPRLGSCFWAINGDTYLDTDYAALYRHFQTNRLTNLMAVYKNENRWWPSNVAFSNGILHTYSKTLRTTQMQHIDTGVAVLRTSEFCRDESISDLSSLYENLSKCQRLSGYEVGERFHEINTVDSLEETSRFLKTVIGADPSDYLGE